MQPLNMTDSTGGGEPGGKSRRVKMAHDDEDDEHDHDDWASGEWSEERADLNQIMRALRPKLAAMYRELVAEEIAGIRLLIDQYFPAEKRVKAGSASTDEFYAALTTLYSQISGTLADGVRRLLYTDLAGAVVAMAAKQPDGVDEVALLAHLESTIGDYAAIEASSHVECALGQLNALLISGGVISRRQQYKNTGSPAAPARANGDAR